MQYKSAGSKTPLDTTFIAWTKKINKIIYIFVCENLSTVYDINGISPEHFRGLFSLDFKIMDPKWCLFYFIWMSFYINLSPFFYHKKINARNLLY